MKPQTAVKIVMPIFFLAGLGMLAAGGYMLVTTRAFVATATQTEGVVVRLEASRGSDSVTYSPVVRFLPSDGEEAIEFESNVSSNPPSFEEGEAVTVLYHPEYPRNAKIESFFELWGLSAIFGGMGAVFCLIPVGSWIYSARRKKQQQYLRQSGVRIDAVFLRSEIDTGMSVNNKHGYRVIAEGKDPNTGSMRTFKSDRMWTDPGTLLKPAQEIGVYIDPQNTEKYFVDTISLGL